VPIITCRVPLLAVLAALSACTAPPIERQPVPITPPKDVAGAAVIRREVPERPAPSTSPPPSLASAAPALPAPPIEVPANVQYVCVVDTGGHRQQTTIEFLPKIAALCRKHPEMGPCQYERDNCRRSGGRVYTANGVEITLATEAEYDKKVMRVRFKTN
jgi:hypothetical protein